MDTNLTNEELATAIRLRVQDHKYWEQIAVEVGVTRKTLLRARQTDRWAEVALEVVNEIKAEAFPVAWQGLLDAAALKDVAACKEILNRVDEVIEQKLSVTAAITLFPHLTTEQLSEIAGHDGDYGTASKDGTGTEGGTGGEDPDA